MTSMEPASAASSPERQYSSVDLPEPLGPTMLTISPASTESDVLQHVDRSPFALLPRAERLVNMARNNRGTYALLRFV